MPTLVLDNFIGGLNNYSPEKIAVNESAILAGFFHTDGNLQSFWGRTVLNATALNGNHIDGLFIYYPTDGSTPLFMAQASNRMFLDITGSGAFRPIFDWSVTGTDVSMVQWGAYVYSVMAGNAMKRWDGFKYTTGTVTCTGNTTLTGGSTSWVTGAVAAGDRVYINSSGSTWDGPYYVQSITNATTIVLTGNGPTVTAKNYIISRVNNAGITAPGTGPTLAAVGSGGSLSIGVYKYKVTYANSHTGFESNPTAAATASVTCVASDSVTVTPNTTTPADLQVDQLKIYRTKAGGSIYYLSSTQSRNQAGYAFAATYTDTTADTALGAELETTHDTPLTTLAAVKLFNNRLYGWAADNTLRFSTLNAPEYWPTNQFGIVDELSIAITEGGYATIGDGGHKIMDAVPEGGSYSSLGTKGGNLLIIRNGGLTYRWHGFDWSDFMITEGFATDCLSTRSAVNYEGVLFWLTKRGPVMLPAGSNVPIPIYEKLFPPGVYQYNDVMSPALLALGAIAWNKNYIWSLNGNCYFYHIPTGTWTEFGGELAASQWAILRTTSGPGGLFYGEYIADGSGSATVYRVFAKNNGVNTYWTGTTGVYAHYRSPMFVGKATESYQMKHVREIRAYWQKPASDQTVSIKVITNGGTTADTTAKTLSSAGTDTRIVTRHSPASVPEGWGFQIDISGTFTKPVILERIEIDYELHGAVQV